MELMTMLAMIFIFAALLAYTIGVWAEHFQKMLSKKHLACFCVGVVLDTTGTSIMMELPTAWDPINTFHMVTGFIALVIMLVHAGWAFWVLYQNKEKMRKQFHKWSIAAWVFWLIPMIGGEIEFQIANAAAASS